MRSSATCVMLWRPILLGAFDVKSEKLFPEFFGEFLNLSRAKSSRNN